MPEQTKVTDVAESGKEVQGLEEPKNKLKVCVKLEAGNEYFEYIRPTVPVDALKIKALRHFDIPINQQDKYEIIRLESEQRTMDGDQRVGEELLEGVCYVLIAKDNTDTDGRYESRCC